MDTSKKLIENISKMPAEAQAHPTTQANVAQAKKVVAQETVRTLEQKAQQNGGKLDAAESQALQKAKTEAGHADANAQRANPDAGHADANAPRSNTEAGRTDAEAGNDVRDRQPSDPARNAPEPADTSTGKRPPTDSSNTRPPTSPDSPPQDQPSGAERSRDGSAADPSRRSIPETTTHPDSDPAQPRATAGNEGRSPTPTDSRTQDGTPRRTTSSGQPSQTTANNSQPPQTSPLPPPRTPPLSPEQSQRLLDNVSKMPPEAQQHPQVLADVAQERRVVAQQTSPEPLPVIHPSQTNQKAASTEAASSQLGRPSSPPQAALFDSVPGVEKTREMRAKENAYLSKHAAPRRSSSSMHVTTATMDAHDLAMQKAALLQDNVHDGLGMRPVLMGQNVSSWRNGGEYHAPNAVQPARIHVSPDTGTPLLTSLHELGHHVDLHLDPIDVAAVVKAAEASESTDWIRNYVSENKNYYLEPKELFARAYAQYIALKSGDPEVRAELEKTLMNTETSWKQWGKSDWIPIEEAITKALRRRTWL